jgi:hypothetical protein
MMRGAGSYELPFCTCCFSLTFWHWRWAELIYIMSFSLALYPARCESVQQNTHEFLLSLVMLYKYIEAFSVCW